MNAISKENNPRITAKEFYFHQEGREEFHSAPHTDCMFNLWSAVENSADFAEFRVERNEGDYCCLSDKTVFLPLVLVCY